MMKKLCWWEVESTGDIGRGWGRGEEGVVTGEGTALSGVDGDNLAAASADQEDPVETLSEDLKELHVWERRVKETRGRQIQ